MSLTSDTTSNILEMDEPRIIIRQDIRERDATPIEPIKWHIFTTEAELAWLTAEWSDLAEQSETSLFVTPQWVHAWHATIGVDVEPRVITGRDSNERLSAIWPMGIGTEGKGLFDRRVLGPMGQAVASGDRLDPLTVRPGLEPELIDQVRQIGQAEADLIHWGELISSHETSHTLQSEMPRRPIRVAKRRVLPVADLPDTYDEFCLTLSKKLRSYVRRQERAADQKGLVWRINDEGCSLDSAIEAFIALHEKCWQHRGKNGNLADSRFAAFVKRFATVAMDRGWLRLHRLCDGSRTLAALLAFHHGWRAYYYQSGWDPTMAELSPGSLCIARAVRTAIDEGLEVFDFLRGDEPYKRRWGQRTDETVSLAEATSTRGRAILTCNDAKETFKRGLSRLAGPRAWETLKSYLPE